MDKKLSNYGEYDEDCEIEEDIQYEGKFDDVDNIDDDQQDEFIESIIGIQTDDYKFDAFIEKLQEIVIEDNFEKLKETFMNKYYQEFEEQEENKLSYMNIFKEYTKTIESYIESNLSKRLPQYKVQDFFKLLKDRTDQVDEQLYEMLLSFTDFNLFKEMMLDYKKSRSKDNTFQGFSLCIEKADLRSNFILEDEIFKIEDRFNLNQEILYNDNDHPRNLIFDFSENIRPYFVQNENIDEEKLDEVEEDIKAYIPNQKISKYYNSYQKNKNNFLDILDEINNELGIEEEENREKENFDKNQDYEDIDNMEDEQDSFYMSQKPKISDYKKKYSNCCRNNNSKNFNSHYKDYSYEEEVKTNKKNLKTEKEKKTKIKQKISNLEEILKMPDEKFYDYLNLKQSIRNWNDFSQAKFHKNSFNDIKMLDIDVNCRGSYIKGFEFFENSNFSITYLEHFEDNFRKFLEDCDRLELLNLNVDFNSFWGGLSNRLIESFDDETPKVTKLIFGSDLHSSFMKKTENENDKKQKDFSINLNSVLDYNMTNQNENATDDFTDDLEKLINYLWYFTDLESNKRNIFFHPILRAMNPRIIKELFNHNNGKYYPGDSIYNYYFSSICGANLQNMLIPLRSKFCGNSAYINNLYSTPSSLNFFESTINFSLENEVNLSFPKLFGEKKFKNNGVIFNINRNSSTVYWPVFYDNLEKTKKKNFTVLHGYKETYRFIDDKLDGYLRKTADFNYTCLDGFKIPFCFPRKLFFKNCYSYFDKPEEEENRLKLNQMSKPQLNQQQKLLLSEQHQNINHTEAQDSENGKEIFIDKLNICSTYSTFNDYAKKFIHVVPKMLNKNMQGIKKYLNSFDMGKFVEFKEKTEVYHEFLDKYKQHDFYGGLGIGDSDEEADDNNNNNDEDDYDY